MVRAFVRVVFSLFCAGASYTAWLAAFLLTAEANSSVAHAIRWLSAPVVTAAGFAVGIEYPSASPAHRRPGSSALFYGP